MLARPGACVEPVWGQIRLICLSCVGTKPPHLPQSYGDKTASPRLGRIRPGRLPVAARGARGLGAARADVHRRHGPAPPVLPRLLCPALPPPRPPAPPRRRRAPARAPRLRARGRRVGDRGLGAGVAVRDLGGRPIRHVTLGGSGGTGARKAVGRGEGGRLGCRMRGQGPVVQSGVTLGRAECDSPTLCAEPVAQSGCGCRRRAH
jgi:hypothetical protein